MLELWRELWMPELSFLRYALLLGLLASPVLGVIGTMVVTRRISSLAGASAHAALGGVGLALYLQRVFMWSFFTPELGAVLGALIAALVVGVVSLSASEREDTVIGVVWAVGMALGLLFLDRTPGYVDWQGYLFGNILLISPTELYLTLALDAAVLLPLGLFYNRLLAVSFDSTFAQLRGVRATAIYLVLLALTALTIVLLMNVVGIILVIAMLTLPAATSGFFARHLWAMMVLSGVLSAFFLTAGLLLSYFCRIPSGPAIVVLAGVFYLAALLLRRNRRG
jgi:zinc transport system permease protein